VSNPTYCHQSCVGGDSCLVLHQSSPPPTKPRSIIIKVDTDWDEAGPEQVENVEKVSSERVIIRGERWHRTFTAVLTGLLAGNWRGSCEGFIARAEELADDAERRHEDYVAEHRTFHR
jgi:hypothetical protein